ncbi:ADP/ATP carrier protein [Salix suchowensis]|nr:ADP/ATP carrier protein [Salix suchowensis]
MNAKMIERPDRNRFVAIMIGGPGRGGVFTCAGRPPVRPATTISRPFIYLSTRPCRILVLTLDMAVQSKPVQKLTPSPLPWLVRSVVALALRDAKTRIQALPSDAKGKGKDDLSISHVLYRIFQKEGLSGLYRGFGATMLNTFSMQYAYFFCYSFVRGSYITRITRKLPPGAKVPALSTAAELAIGAIAGALAQIFTIPVSVIATRQQVGRTDRKTPGAEPIDAEPAKDSDDSFLGVAREIVEEEGVTGLWLGIKPGLVLTVNPAITYGVFERLKSVVLAAQQATSSKLSPWTTFVIGALSKTLATV